MRFYEIAVNETFSIATDGKSIEIMRRLPRTDAKIWGHNRAIDINNGTIWIIGDPVIVEPYNYYCGA